MWSKNWSILIKVKVWLSPLLPRVAHYLRASIPNQKFNFLGISTKKCKNQKQHVSMLPPPHIDIDGRISQKVKVWLSPLLPRVAHYLMASIPNPNFYFLGNSTTKCKNQKQHVSMWPPPHIDIDCRMSQKVKVWLSPLLPRVAHYLRASIPNQQFNFL